MNQEGFVPRILPISTGEAACASVLSKFRDIPLEVIEVWNDAIVYFYSNGRSEFKRMSIAVAIARRTGLSTSEVCDNKWLEVENLYREQGWKVEYDQKSEMYSFDKQAN